MTREDARRKRPTLEALEGRNLQSSLIMSPRDAASGLPVGLRAPAELGQTHDADPAPHDARQSGIIAILIG